VIALDTSAILAVLQNEPDADRCQAAMTTDDVLVMSAGTLAELRIVAGQRGAGPALDRLLNDLALEIVPVTGVEADAVGAAFRKWGKGCHPAGLNFGDCFAYVLAASRNCPLLFVGDDFSKTDLVSA
jgi:ribonuclease VapC